MPLRDRALLCAVGLVLCPVAGFAQLTTLGSKVWQQGDPGLNGTAEAGDALGEAVATGDFNCDGFDDLVVGIPHEDVDFGGSNRGSAGAVQIFYGAKAGLPTGADEILTEADTSSANPSTNDHFGWAVAAYTSGDTCPDGSIRPRLAVGAPDEDYNGHDDAGMVFLFRYRSNLGHFEFVRDLVQGDINVLEDESGDQFGYALAAIVLPDLVECVAGAENAPGLAVGAPGEDDNPVSSSDAGAVFVFRPRFCAAGNVFEWESPANLCESLGASTIDCIVFRQGSDGLAGTPEEDDRFGEALSGRKAKRLIIGVPGENSDAGIVQVIYDSASGLSDEVFEQDNLENGASEAGDRFGAALAEGDFDGDSDRDLAVGVPGEDVSNNTVASGGAVAVIRAAGIDLTHTGDLLVTQNDFQTAEDLDQFGSSLAAGDFNDSGQDDLAIGVPHEDTGTTEDTGEIHVVYGSPSGLSVATFQTLSQNTSGIPSSSEECDLWGYALAAGNFDGALGADLALGAPGENGNCLSISGSPPLPTNNEGAMFVLYGGLPGGFLSQITVDSPNTVSEGTPTESLTVHRTGSAVIAAGVHFEATTGSAVLGSDFSASTGDLSWAVGNTSDKTVSVPILDDSNGEPSENFFLELSLPATGVQVLDDVTQVTITDNDTFVAFSDDFETSATDAWTSATASGNTLDQSSLFPYLGQWSLRLVLNDTSSAFVRDDRPFSATYHARFYLRLLELTMQPGDAFDLFTGFTPAGLRTFRLQVLAGAGTRFIVGEVFDDAGASAGATAAPFPLGRHAVEISWAAAPGPGTNSGFLTVKIDGATDVSLLGKDNDTLRVDRVQLGAVAGLDVSTSGEFALDEFASSAASNLDQISAFGDVAKADPLWDFIHSMYNDIVTQGCETGPPRRFCKQDAVSREELALFLMRARNGPKASYGPCSSAPFTDVPQGNAFCRYIQPLKDDGITNGCGGTNFCPKNPVRRGELAVLLARTLNLTTSACGAPPFSDVPTNDLRCPFIQEIKNLTISNGCGGGNYCPDQPVRRQELAILLQRAFDYRLPVSP